VRIEQELTEVINHPSGSERLTQKCLDLIKAHDDRLRCMVFVDEDAALASAANLDQQFRMGAQPLPLQGLPVVVKEIFSVAGMPESFGSKIPAGKGPKPEGTFIKRLRSAGCVILGKTFSTEFAFGQFNLNKAMPVNPADPVNERVTGGSSSGSAAAQAAQYCSFAVGTDTGGSVRGPAAMCGVAGYKPSARIWPMDGIFQLSPRFDAPGIFTDSVHDARLVYGALRNATVPLLPRLEGIQIGVPRHWFFSDLDDQVHAAMKDTLELITAAGVEIVPIEFPDMSFVQQYFAEYLPEYLRAQFGGDVLQSHWGELDELTQSRLLTSKPSIPESVAYDQLLRMQHSVDEAFQKAGVSFWILPTVPCVAPLLSSFRGVREVADWQAYVSRNTRCVNALEMAACSIPLARKGVGALPVGLQVAGHQDTQVLALAAALEEIIGPLK
jgi:aspartyl-tRNA(Asn)/glutamyl-tRNA(Gln) amidotransferase subunit A